jgi:site-specific recombinase XerC
MTSIVTTVQAFFTDRLISQRQASPHTVAAYRDTVRMLLKFAGSRTSKTVSKLDFVDLNAATVAAFLDYLEHERDARFDARTRSRSPVRWFRSLGSVRGAAREGGPYRDPLEG